MYCWSTTKLTPLTEEHVQVIQSYVQEREHTIGAAWTSNLEEIGGEIVIVQIWNFPQDSVRAVRTKAELMDAVSQLDRPPNNVDLSTNAEQP